MKESTTYCNRFSLVILVLMKFFTKFKNVYNNSSKFLNYCKNKNYGK